MRLHCPSNSLSFMDITHFSRLTSYRCIAKKTPNILISGAARAREACACGAPELSKSTHFRKFGNHVTALCPTDQRPTDRRPSVPQAYQCKITQSTYRYGNLRFIWREIAQPLASCEAETRLNKHENGKRELLLYWCCLKYY